MDTLGIIDIGSNSVRLSLIKISKDLSFRLIDSHKETVRLGDGFDEDGRIREEKSVLLFKTLRMFKRLCDSQQVTKIIAVATAAIRKAKNGKLLIQKIADELSIFVEVISGDQEAFLDYIAVSSSLFTKDALILDIGGGSFELALMKQRRLLHSISIPIGSIDLTQAIGSSDPLSKQQEKELKKFILEKLQTIPWLKEAKGLPLVGIGGTCRNISKIDMLKTNYPLDIIHGYTIRKEDLFKTFDEIKKLSLAERREIPGLSAERSDIFVGPYALACFLVESIQSREFISSGKGVREGLFFHYLQEHYILTDHPLNLSLENTAKNMNLNLNHAFHVRKLTHKLFDGTKELHQIHKDLSNIIDTASLLHDSGIIINYYNHHRNSFYVILNAPIYGLTHKELLMSAYIASFHRKKKGENGFQLYESILNKEDIYIIHTVSLLLRLAESLDKSMSNIVSDLCVTIQKDTVIIKISADEYPELEINDAITARAKFKKHFKKNLIIL